ncbi:hypothetical protein [Streptomyces sp. NPDC002763]|uniref:hypothetical protein n=1 Tax=Streptomyces sp. NPDC002763 TaxID=3154427 RepID=UPI003332146A
MQLRPRARRAWTDVARRAWHLLPPDRYATWEPIWLRAYLGDCREVFLLDGNHHPSADEYLTLRRHTYGLATFTDVLKSGGASITSLLADH